MKKALVFSLFTLSMMMLASTSFAQFGGGEGPGGERPRGGPGGERGPRGGGPGGGGPRGGGGPERMLSMMPVIKALDADGNGSLSAAEIRGAAGALASLDKNGDGTISTQEMMPDMSAMRGRGGPGGDRGGRGGGDRSGRGGGERGGRGGGERGGRGGGGDAGGFAERMMQNDTDGDGKISEAEAPERMKGFFANLDADSDGYVTTSELDAMAKRWSGGGGQRGGGGKRPKRPGAAE